MNLLYFKNSSEGLRCEDVDLNMPHRFVVFIRHLCPIILQLVLLAQFLQHLLEHLRDLASTTSIILEPVNIPI
jgi:hypothetical protein